MFEWLLGPNEEGNPTGSPQHTGSAGYRSAHFAEEEGGMSPVRVQAPAFASAGNNFAALNSGTPKGFGVFCEEYGPALQEYCSNAERQCTSYIVLQRVAHMSHLAQI